MSRPTGPTSPTLPAHLAHRPLGLDEAHISGGVWGRWQETNRTASIPGNLEHLESEGALDNLRLAAGERTGDFRGPVFMDAAVYKSLEAAAWELLRDPASPVGTWFAQTVGLLERAQGEDGYLNSYIQTTHPDQRYRDLAHSHEVFISGFLLQAAVATDRAGLPQAEVLMGVARRFADHLVTTFLGTGNGIDGHPGVEMGLIELYRQTGEESYLRLAEEFIRGRGHGRVDPGGRRRYFQDHATVLDAPTEVGHAVRALFLEAGVVDLAIETGDSALLEASIRRWEDMVATKTYLTGGLGSRHAEEAFGDAYELPPDRAYNESCAAFGSILWSWRLLLATGQSRFADLIERTLFNAFAGSTSADGTRFFYINPLQRRSDHWESDDPGRRHGWFACPCCPPNIARMVSVLPTYLFTRREDTIYLHQFAAARIEMTAGSGRFALNVQTAYPWDGDVTVIVEQAPDSPAGIALRIPGWCEGASIEIDGEPVPADPDRDGYVVLRRVWQTGSVVRLHLPMPPRLTFPHPAIDAIRGTVAIERGPLVYCFEQIDQPEGVDVDRLALPDRPRLRLSDAEHLPGVGESRTIEIECLGPTSEPVTGFPYLTTPAHVPSSALRVAVAIPYFQWDNRDGGAMRVWVPMASAPRPAAADHSPLPTPAPVA